MSVDVPILTAENPADERLRYQMPADGRYTEMSVLPSPSKSNGERIFTVAAAIVIFVLLMSEKDIADCLNLDSRRRRRIVRNGYLFRAVVRRACRKNGRESLPAVG